MKRINAHQWLHMSSLFLLGPALRLLPRATAAQAGRAAWLAPLPALGLMLAAAVLLSRFLQGRPADAGLPELIVQRLGLRWARPLLGGLSAWLLFYGAFVLRSGADRLQVTAFPRSGPGPFILSLGLVCLIAALGSLRSLARFARLSSPFVLGILLLMLAAALPGVRRANLLPVTVYDAPGIARAALPVTELLALGLFLPLFFLGYVEGEPVLRPRFSRWLLGQAALLGALLLVLVGNFSGTLTAQLAQPFFTLVRNLVLFRCVERTEALVVSCWVFPDLLLASLCLHAAQHCLRLGLGETPLRDSGPRLRLDRGRWLIGLCGLLMIAAALGMGEDAAGLRRLSERVVPAVNLGVCVLTVPALLLGERLRRRLKARRKG